ncbi:pre-mRNA-splicing factor prp46 [Maudiozyma exigua]|uniref:Pre-mRNA-splicing factor PRP46 n=1 Tax=Maudiozyma exigua TaxID=34358 RepID=A0A9P7BB69_MAUEX|nr:pre-mRNA-splicing factor prp46 [Kazachstania exigua]
MATLPTHLQQELNDHKATLKNFNTATEDILQKNMATSKSLAVRETSAASFDNHSALERRRQLFMQKPKWHASWKLHTVINGHLGWVRCVATDCVSNKWFVTGSNDTTIKVWDMSTNKLKLTLAGHAMGVRGLAVSKRHPYMFSASEDKLVKCWDLEKNAAIRDYYGHHSGVHTVAIHPTLDLIASAGRDSVVKLWDIRTKEAVVTLVGHKGPINKVYCLPVDPQIVSCSTDATVILWDIIAGKGMKTLTHHKRNVRDLALHPNEFSFASACTDDIRSWRLPEGSLLTNFASQETGIINTLSINEDGVLFAGSDNGAMSFYDYKSGHLYQSTMTRATKGSLESEKGILTSTFDKSGFTLITGETDKSIKIWKQSVESNPTDDPGLPWNPMSSSQRF